MCGHAQGDTGLGGFENILGSAHGDTLTGDANANGLWGGAGNDTLQGGAGGDTLNGGAGTDTLSYAGSSAGVTVNIRDNTASGGDAAGDAILNFDNITGSAHGDALQGNANANVITGGAGNDTLIGLAGGDTLNGGAGTDTVSYAGSNAGVNVTINGSASGGHAAGDSLTGFENLDGSLHNDTFTGDSNVNVLVGGAGRDSISGLGGNDVLKGGAGVDTLAGGDGADKLLGGAGDDSLFGNNGTDEYFFKSLFGTDSITFYASGEKIWICIGSGRGNGNLQVNWTSAADGANWKITVTSKDGSGNSRSEGIITLGSVSQDPGSAIEWSDPSAAAGTGCNF